MLSPTIGVMSRMLTLRICIQYCTEDPRQCKRKINKRHKNWKRKSITCLHLEMTWLYTQKSQSNLQTTVLVGELNKVVEYK